MLFAWNTQHEQEQCVYNNTCLHATCSMHWPRNRSALHCRCGSPQATSILLTAAGQAVMKAGGVDALGEAALYFCISDDMQAYAQGAVGRLCNERFHMPHALVLQAWTGIVCNSLNFKSMLC